MKVYIAGQITGLEDELVDQMFNTTAEAWRKLGWEPVNPVELDDGGHNQLPWRDYMARDLPLLIGCDAIALIPGWEHSAGARIEYTNAGLFGLRIFDAAHPAPPPPDHEFIDPGNVCCLLPDYAHLPAWRYHKTGTYE